MKDGKFCDNPQHPGSRQWRNRRMNLQLSGWLFRFRLDFSLLLSLHQGKESRIEIVKKKRFRDGIPRIA
jgi:hypothetical protein